MKTNTDKLFGAIKRNGFGEPQSLIMEFTILRQEDVTHNRGWIVYMKNHTVRSFSTNGLGLYEISLEELDALSATMLEAAVSVKTASEAMKRIRSEIALSTPEEAQSEKEAKV